MTTPAINTDQNSLITSYWTRTAALNSGGAVTTTQKLNTNIRRHTEQRPASVNNPQSRTGWRKPSAWSHTIRDVTPFPQAANYGVLAFDPKTYFSDRYYDGSGWTSTTGPTYPPGSNDESRAIIKALDKLKRQHVNLAQAFAEREQTVNLFYDAANLICNSIEAWRRKNPKYLWDYIRRFEGKQGRGSTIPNSWLQTQYGWKPSMSDVQGSCDLLHDRYFNGQAFRASVTGTIRNKGRVSWRKSSLVSTAFGMHIGGNFDTITKVRLDYNLIDPTIASLASTGIANPVALAWELLPYSFVVDWFTDVGGWLNAMDAALGWNFLGGTKTVFQKIDSHADSWYGVGATNDGGRQYFQPLGSPSYVENSRVLTRTVYSSSPLPRFPGLKNPVSADHVASGISLLISAFR